MSHTLTEAPLPYPAAVTVPDDGDDLDAASVEVAFQALADRTALAHSQLSGTIPCFGPSPIECQAGIISGANISCNGNLLANSNFICSGPATFAVASTFTGAATFNNAANFNSVINHDGSLNGSIGHFASLDTIDLLVSGLTTSKVRRQLRYLRITADADQTFLATSYDHVSCGNVLSVARAWNITTTGLVVGDSIEFSNRSLVNVQLKVGGSTIFTLIPAPSIDYKVRLVWDGSAFFAG